MAESRTDPAPGRGHSYGYSEVRMPIIDRPICSSVPSVEVTGVVERDVRFEEPQRRRPEYPASGRDRSDLGISDRVCLAAQRLGQSSERAAYRTMPWSPALEQYRAGWARASAACCSNLRVLDSKDEKSAGHPGGRCSPGRSTTWCEGLAHFEGLKRLLTAARHPVQGSEQAIWCAALDYYDLTVVFRVR